MSVRNMELKTTCKTLKNNATPIVLGGQVPSGMTRWVTFLMVDTNAIADASDGALHFASMGVSNPTEASVVAVTHRKLRLEWVASDMSVCNCNGLPIMLPDGGPDPETPLFSIAEGKWLGIFTSLGATANVFMQYFDE